MPTEEPINTQSVPAGNMNLPASKLPSTKEPDDLYIAISVLRDGASVAEITTPLDMELKGDGRVTYTLDATLFNSGMYEVPVVLCRKENRQLVGISSGKNRFVIKGDDPIRGAAFKLEDTWEYHKHS